MHSFNILQRAANADHTSQSTPWLRNLSDLAISAICIADAKLRYRSQFSGDPAGKNLAALLLAEARAGEIAFGDECNNVNDDLMLVEYSVDYDWNDGGKICFPSDFDEDNDQATCLENCTRGKY